jgi:hypothetical protein
MKDRMKHIQRFTTNLATHWLPTNERLQYQEGRDPKCLFCQEPESNSHFFLCNAQLEWKNNFLERLGDHLADTYTPFPLIQHIVNNMAKMLESNESEIENPISACDQGQIGWQNAFNGFITKKWEQIILGTKYTQGSKKELAMVKKSTTNWTVKLITFLWESVHEKWIERCNHVHKSNKEKESTAHRQDIVTKVTQLYNRAQEHAPPDQQVIFGVPLEERIQTRIGTLRQWFRTSQKNFLVAKERALNKRYPKPITLDQFFPKKEYKLNKANTGQNRTNTEQY